MTTTDVGFVAGLYDDMPEDEYHADPVPSGSLSQSGAKLLLPPSCPALFAYQREHPVPPTRAMNLGSAAHKLVLGRGAELVVIDADDYRSRDARLERDAVWAAGKIPLLPAENTQVQDMAAALRQHRTAAALFDPERGGRPEASLFWQDDATGIWRRCRFDWMPPESHRMIIGDYKTAESADPEKWSRAAANFSYHMQHAWYIDGLSAIFPDADVRFVFVVQEKTPPYLISVVELDYPAVLAGAVLNRQAIDIYDYCTRTGDWYGYMPDTEVRTISLPSWAVR